MRPEGQEQPNWRDVPEAMPPVRPTTVSCEQTDTIQWHCSVGRLTQHAE